MAAVINDDAGSSRAASVKDLKHKEAEIGNPNMEVTDGKQGRAGGVMGFLKLLERRGDVEFRGATPVPYEDRKETSYFKIFTLWFCLSCNPLP